jgi:hypothetical protein
MASLPDLQTLKEAFLYCRDMDASLAERLEAFSFATRRLLRSGAEHHPSFCRTQKRSFRHEYCHD